MGFADKTDSAAPPSQFQRPVDLSHHFSRHRKLCDQHSCRMREANVIYLFTFMFRCFASATFFCDHAVSDFGVIIIRFIGDQVVKAPPAELFGQARGTFGMRRHSQSMYEVWFGRMYA